MDACYFVQPHESGEMISLMFPEVATIRAIAKVMAVRARLRLFEGNADAATDDVALLLRAGRHLQDQPFLVPYLIGLHIGEQAYRVLLDMPRLAPHAPDYEKLLSKLRLMYQNPRKPSLQLQVEQLHAWDMAQRFAKDTDGDGRLDLLVLPRDIFGLDPSLDGIPLSPAVSFEAMTKQIDDYFDQLRSGWTGDFQTARSVSERLQEEAKRNPRSIVGLVGPALTYVVDIYYRSLARCNGTQVVLELHAYRATNEKWPQTLEEGLSKSVAQPRLDPFSGRPFIYRLKDGEPLLYSIGANGVDDGGQRFLGDDIIWPR